eukprot:scaffold56791_cov61-Cyclotella_meneghiniana.AAC.5
MSTTRQRAAARAKAGEERETMNRRLREQQKKDGEAERKREEVEEKATREEMSEATRKAAEASAAAADAATTTGDGGEEQERMNQLRREQQKKDRDAERKREEEEAKAARDAAAEAAAAAAAAAAADEAARAAEGEKEKPDDSINEHLNEMNTGGAGKEGDGRSASPANLFEVDDEDDEMGERSPQKKRSKKEKKKEKKTSRKSKENGEKASAEKGGESILKAGRFSVGASDEKKRKEAEEKTRAEKAAEAARAKAKEEEEKKEFRSKHIHQHKRNVLECSLVCSQDEEQQRYNELPAGVRLLLSNMQKVDKNVCLEPVEEGEASGLWEKNDLPYDHTELGSYVRQGGGVQAFSMKKPRKWQKDQGLADEDSLICQSDKEPEKIMERVAGEWGKAGGKRLHLKEISSFDTKTVATIFHLRYDNTASTVHSEFLRALDESKDIAENEDQEGARAYLMDDLPTLNVRSFIPRIDGQDTTTFSGWSGRQHENRKCISFECDGAEVEMVHYLVSTGKNRGIFKKYWGHKVYVAAIVDNKSKKKGAPTQNKLDLAAMASCSRMHVNYQGNTRMDGIRGILNVDKPVNFYSVANPTKLMGRITLRHILYKYFKMSDGHTLFEEVHQAEPMAPVDVVVPNAEEAERLMLMIHKNSAAFFTYYLQSFTELGETLIAEVVRASMDPILVNMVGRCKWDEKLMLLTTPEDEEMEKNRKMEEAAWYKDEYGDHMVDTSKKEKMSYSSKEALDDLHCEHSFKTIHKKKGNQSTDVSEREVFKVGSKTKPMEVDSDGDEDEEYLNLSAAELIALLKKTKLKAKKAVGSQPNSERSGSGSRIEDEESSEDSSSASSGSSSSSVESVTKNVTFPSSGEGNSAARKPGQGG